MTPELWQRVSHALARAGELPPDERAAFLQDLRCQDAVVAAQVESLLRHQQTSGLESIPAHLWDDLGEACPPQSFASLDSTPHDQEPTSTPGSARPEPAGTWPNVPGYEIVAKLGQGGMGVVYKARQVKLKRLVALKMILSGAYGSPQEAQRFRLEAEALARLQHPNIVQIHEIGDHEGRPFFSMEFVEGDNLAKKLAGAPQDAGQAAELVQTLARAIHVAHQRGVIHRDLKPANVLLTADGVRKISDFGLAKQLDAAVGQTRSGAIMGTPSYMAPEQASGNLKEIGPATDVYALGGILYEMLTGRPPFRGATALDTLEQVRTQEPVPPRRLVAKLPRDLETICLKCLQKTPAKRYASAEALSDDLRRFLNGEPIKARPVSRVETLWRWCRRKPVVASLAGAVGLAVVGLAFATVLLAQANARTNEQWDRAEQNLAKAKAAEATARAINRFLDKDLLEVARPEDKGRGVTIREALDAVVPKIDKAFAGQPEVEASVRQTIGYTYYRLGLYPEAEPQLRRSLDLCCNVFGPEHPDTLSAANSLAQLLQSQGKLAEAEPLARQTVEARRRVSGAQHPDTLTAVDTLATLLYAQARLTEAEPLFRENLESYQRVLGRDHRDTLTAVNNFAMVLQAQSKLTDAEALLRQNLESRRRVLGADHPDTLEAVGNLAELLRLQAKLDEAEPLYRQNLEAYRRVFGPEHPDTLTEVNNFAMFLQAQGKLQEAYPLYQQNLEARRRILGPDHRSTLVSLNNLAWLLEAQGKLAEAEPLYRQSLETFRRVAGPDNPRGLTAANNLARLLHTQGKLTEAEPLFRETLELRRKVLPAGHLDIAGSLTGLGSLLTEKGRAQEAEPLLRESVDIVRRSLPKGHGGTALAESALGGCLTALGRHAQAEPLLLASYETLKSAQGVAPANLRKALERIIELYEASEKPEKAAQWREKRSRLEKPAASGEAEMK